ncbi:MAG TPA: hypothetical protein VEF34_16285 [Syntrophobacteraceae bacterium]|nr:hypothetical protein [Syntrophobacteraceae bacterium]
MTKVGDVVLVYMDNNPSFFARVDEISADVKPGWFNVKLLVLQVPLLVVTWILREPYYNGGEFTMGGRAMRIEKVNTPAEEHSQRKPEDTRKSPAKPELVVHKKQKDEKTGKQGKVISISDHRKKDPE